MLEGRRRDFLKPKYPTFLKIFFLTISGHVQLDEVLQVLYVRGKPLDLIVAEAQLPQAIQAEEVLQGPQVATLIKLLGCYYL